MSYTLYIDLDVLASSPTEINLIAARLDRPSADLVDRIVRRDGQERDEVEAVLRRILSFTRLKNLDTVDPDVNKARRFRICFADKLAGVVHRHLSAVSLESPGSIFLIERYDTQSSFTERKVMRGGRVVTEVLDGDHIAEGQDWVLPDIFAPYRTEYFSGVHEFGGLWPPWLDALIAAAKLLDDSSPEPK